MKSTDKLPKGKIDNRDLWLAIRDLTKLVETQNGRIGRLEDSNKWIVRTGIGTLLGAFLGALFMVAFQLA